jgi:hyperosmotically inducible protein
MNMIQNSFTAAAVAAALSLPMAGAAFADTTPALDNADTVMLATNETMKDAGDATSDTWITTKVKSSLLAEDATPGMDIEVETKDGVVSLSGTVATEAEREAAVNKAKAIEGVREVSADGLKAAD